MVQQQDDASGRIIAAFQESERRKRLLFRGVVVFLVLDAALFLGLLGWAFWIVQGAPDRWHIFLAPALLAAVGTVITVMLVKAVYRAGEGVNSDDINPAVGGIADVLRDLSGS